MLKQLWDKVGDVYFLIPHDYRVESVWRVVKDFCWNRYTTIKPRTLGHSWCERRDLLLHMSMEILGQFLEKGYTGRTQWYGERGPKIGGKYVIDEMDEIWLWWRVTYQKEYPESEDKLFGLIEGRGPEIRMEPLDPPHPHAQKMVFHFKTEEQEVKYRALTAQYRVFEQMVEDKADEMLQRLAAVRQYM